MKFDLVRDVIVETLNCDLSDVTEEALATAREAAASLLSNPVIEDVVSVRAADDEDASR